MQVDALLTKKFDLKKHSPTFPCGPIGDCATNPNLADRRLRRSMWTPQGPTRRTNKADKALVTEEFESTSRRGYLSQSVRPSVGEVGLNKSRLSMRSTQR